MTAIELAEPADDASDVDRPIAARVMDLVHLVAERGPMTVYALAAATERPLSSTYRYVDTLRRAGYLERAARAGAAPRYELGPRAWQLLDALRARTTRLARTTAVEEVLRETLPHAQAGALPHLAGRLVDTLAALDRP